MATPFGLPPGFDGWLLNAEPRYSGSRLDCDEDGYPDVDDGFYCDGCDDHMNAVEASEGRPQPVILDGTEYCRTCARNILVARREKRLAKRRKPATTATATVIPARDIAS